ncbi:hypothetical protein HDU97_002189 [Phlyctochytrium planicorne]|nr:hypothetical protein HDU97_002189 [Phlyctochytrium planicorne]
MKTTILLSVLVSVTALTSSAVPLNERSSSINWVKCPDIPGMQCATVTVPLNHLDKNDTRTVPIAITKYPARKPSRGSIFVNPGGPGSGGRYFAFSIASLANRALDYSFDFIGFDPRGIGASKPVICHSSAALHVNSDYQEYLGYPGMKGSADVETYAAFAEVFAKGCRLHSAFEGEYVKYLSTASVARDMDVVREALGEDVLNFYGGSYGSFLGLTYVNMFPDRVGRMIVDGIVDPVAQTTNFFDRFKKSVVDMDELFVIFCDECIKAGPACQLSKLTSLYLAEPKSTPGKQLAASIEKATEAFTSLPALNAFFPGVVKSSDLHRFFYNMLYRPSRWPVVFNILADLFIRKSADSFRDELFSPPDFCSAEDQSGSNGIFAVNCVDGEDLNALSLDAVKDGALKMNLLWFARRVPLVFGLYCWKWERPVERYVGPWDNRLKNKMLIISSRVDPVTPLSAAKLVHSMLHPKNSSYLLIQDTVGHTSLAQPTLCTLMTIAKFLFTGEVDADVDGVARCASENTRSMLVESDDGEMLKNAALAGDFVIKANSLRAV